MQTTIKSGIRAAFRLCGYDLHKYQPMTSFPEVRGLLLRRQGVQCVIDGGANVGAYGRQLRSHGYCRRILSIEPQAGAFTQLRDEAAGDPKWDCVRCALGERDGTTMSLNVTSNSVSSSLLPMSEKMQQLFSAASFSHTESVDVRSLDALIQEGPLRDQPLFLKLDVQGYEDRVLAGAEKTLRHTVGIQLELAIEPLYEGAQPMVAMIHTLNSMGYVLAAVTPNTFHPATSHLLEVDAMFARFE
jgi:FkbM family methyltransferase